MATKEIKRSTLLAQPTRQRLNPHLKTRVYELVFRLNRGFSITLANLAELEQSGLFRRDYLRAYRNLAEELRAGTNRLLTGKLRHHEEQEWARFGRLKVKWERRFKEPVRQRSKKR